MRGVDRDLSQKSKICVGEFRKVRVVGSVDVE